MSRTVHHVRYDHWNVKGRAWHYWRGEDEYPVGNVIWDLRFYAGCKRVPARLRHATPCWDGWPYSWGHGGITAIREWANQIEGGLRAAARDYGRDAVKVHRAGGDLEGLAQPDGRTRHSALWEAW